jgi:hypothetical protein
MTMRSDSVGPKRHAQVPSLSVLYNYQWRNSIDVMAGDEMTVLLFQDRFLFSTDVVGQRAARMEGASMRNVHRAGRLALDCRGLCAVARVYPGQRGQQRLGVRMQRMFEKVIAGT